MLARLPSMNVDHGHHAGNPFKLFRRPLVSLGMAAVTLFFMGQFALFTYLRPFLETATHASVDQLSLMLLLIGVAGFVGTTMIGALLKDRLYLTLSAIPALMAMIAVALIYFGSSIAVTATLLGMWGAVRDGGSGGLVDLAREDAAARCRSRRRAYGRRRSTRGHVRSYGRRSTPRHQRLSSDLHYQRDPSHDCGAARCADCPSSGEGKLTAAPFVLSPSDG
jgi:hypothetical protein